MEVRLRVLLNSRACYFCTRDKITQLLAMSIIFCINHEHGTLLRIFPPGFFSDLPVKKKIKICLHVLQSGDVTSDSPFLISHTRGSAFIPKTFVYDVHSK